MLVTRLALHDQEEGSSVRVRHRASDFTRSGSPAAFLSPVVCFADRVPEERHLCVGVGVPIVSIPLREGPLKRFVLFRGHSVTAKVVAEQQRELFGELGVMTEPTIRRMCTASELPVNRLERAGDVLLDVARVRGREMQRQLRAVSVGLDLQSPVVGVPLRSPFDAMGLIAVRNHAWPCSAWPSYSASTSTCSGSVRRTDFSGGMKRVRFATSASALYKRLGGTGMVVADSCSIAGLVSQDLARAWRQRRCGGSSVGA